EVLEEIRDPRKRTEVVARDFHVARVQGDLLLTAYYEPELAGRLERNETFRYAIYRPPPGAIAVSRREIDAGALAGPGPELAWTHDPVALFLLHVQGSGAVRLADGRRLGLHYAGTNGRPYRSLARTMVERGLLQPGATSVPDIRRVLASLPLGEVMGLLATN